MFFNDNSRPLAQIWQECRLDTLNEDTMLSHPPFFSLGGGEGGKGWTILKIQFSLNQFQCVMYLFMLDRITPFQVNTIVCYKVTTRFMNKTRKLHFMRYRYFFTFILNLLNVLNSNNRNQDHLVLFKVIIVVSIDFSWQRNFFFPRAGYSLTYFAVFITDYSV